MTVADFGDKAPGLSLFLASLVLFCMQNRAYGHRDQIEEQKFTKVTTVSCPGKVLIAGGYLVLEAPNIGLTVSSSSRFYTSIATVEGISCVQDHKLEKDEILLQVLSPQFHEHYLFAYDASRDSIRKLSDHSNDFVERCLLMTLAFVQQQQQDGEFLNRVRAMRRRNEAIAIKLRAHNDFYSQTRRLLVQGLPLLSSSLLALPAFLPCLRDAQSGAVKVSKTGLGSSAALVSSLVGALLQYFSVIRLEKRCTEDRRLVHNLAQLVHANAQGKIGSGFDVSAAIYGE